MSKESFQDLVQKVDPFELGLLLLKDYVDHPENQFRVYSKPPEKKEAEA